MRSRVALVAQGIMEVPPNQPFTIMISNLSKNPMNIPKRKFIVLDVEVPSQIVVLDRTPYSKSNDPDPVRTVPHYKET